MDATIHSFCVIMTPCAVCMLFLHGFYFLFLCASSFFSSQPSGLLRGQLVQYVSRAVPLIYWGALLDQMVVFLSISISYRAT